MARSFPNGVVQALLTDFYQVTMAYAYWRAKKEHEHAVFDMFFRKNPFHGEFTIFAGLHDCVNFIKNFHFTDEDISYLKTVLPASTDSKFFDYLKELDASSITLYAIEEGSVVFPKLPLLRVEGPLAVVQLLETTLLNLVNFASLITTNAVRFCLAAGPNKSLLEFGLRRAQGPDGGLSASKYAYVGGFAGTSNVLAGKEFGIPVVGTHAHAFVSSFHDNSHRQDFSCLLHRKDCPNEEKAPDFYTSVRAWLDKIASALGILSDQTNKGELQAFTSYASSFPTKFIALVDTYNIARSGIPNFCAVAFALNEFGYQPVGIRLDSGDLAYFSRVARREFKMLAEKFDAPWMNTIKIVASNDINEETLYSLIQQGHEIDSFGIGTHLVTCQKQPALGCVFKLVEINGMPRMKLSEEVSKINIPGRKNVYRLFGADGKALIDLMQKSEEEAPAVGSRVLCRHPTEESKRAYVKPARVEQLLKLMFKDGVVQGHLPTLQEIRDKIKASLSSLREDHLRSLNPTPYKVSVTDKLYTFMHALWLENAPIGELS